MRLLDLLPGLAVEQQTRGRGRTRATRRVYRLAGAPRRPHQGPGWVVQFVARCFGRVICPRCTAIVGADYRFCTSCGHLLPTGAAQPGQCHKCNTPLAAGARHCPKCSVAVSVRQQQRATQRQVVAQRQAAGVPAKPKPVRIGTYTKDDGTVVGEHTRELPSPAAVQAAQRWDLAERRVRQP